jgi:hypothetical protein
VKVIIIYSAFKLSYIVSIFFVLVMGSSTVSRRN